MEQLAKRFTQDMAYTVALDTTKAVTVGIHEIVLTLFEALALVVLVVYIFLQGWRATLIPLLAVPVSLIGTFVVFPLLGFSINTLSLFGLVLAIGLVVDDAIVVVEAVEHHIEQGMSPREATLPAMKEVAGPVVSGAAGLSWGVGGRALPTSFIPEEDQGFLLLSVQRPAAASLERTEAVAKKVEGILAKTDGVKSFATIVGFSLLTRVSSTYNAFMFIQLKPWSEREGAALEARGILGRLNRALATQIPEATAF